MPPTSAPPALPSATARLAERDDARALADRLGRGDGTDDCPACGGTLSPARRAALVREKEAIAADLDRRAADANARSDAANRLRDDIGVRYKLALAAIDAARQRENEWQRLHIEVQEGAGASAEVTRAEGEIAVLTRRIDGKDFAADLRAEYKTVAAERAGLAYDAAEHDRLRRDAAREDDLVLRRQGIVDAANSAAELRARADALTARRDAARRDLDAGLPFGDAPARLDRVRDQIRALAFDGAAFERTRASRDALAEAPARRERLLAAREARADLATDAARAAERHATLTTDHAALAVRIADLARLDDARRAGEAAVATATTAASAADAALDTRRHDTARASAARDAVATAEAAHRAAAKAAHSAHADEALYKHLREAFSRRGIPSLIIEDALPEIETRANDLLDRLSDGRMRMAFETQRNRKSDDGTIETLEVKVADESGQLRSYETFSGGEAFRVNFALRVALSQMLAARSGVDRADARDRRRLRHAGPGGRAAAHRGHQLGARGLRQDPRHHPPRRDEGSLPRPHRSPQRPRHRLDVRSDRGVRRARRMDEGTSRAASHPPHPRRADIFRTRPVCAPTFSAHVWRTGVCALHSGTLCGRPSA